MMMMMTDAAGLVGAAGTVASGDMNPGELSQQVSTNSLRCEAFIQTKMPRPTIVQPVAEATF
jgi:hypothetical protein